MRRLLGGCLRLLTGEIGCCCLLFAECLLLLCGQLGRLLLLQLRRQRGVALSLEMLMMLHTCRGGSAPKCRGAKPCVPMRLADIPPDSPRPHTQVNRLTSTATGDCRRSSPS